MADLPSILQDGLDFIGSQQRADGGFSGQTSSDPLYFADAVSHPTVFFTALIMQSVGGLEHSAAIMEPASRYLLRHKSTGWSWNYWQRDAEGRRMRGYPDDLDDTACAVAALRCYQPALVNGRALGFIGQQLIAAEIATGGPYETWLVPKADRPAWHDVDVAVNANIAHMLHLFDITLPALERFLAEALRSRRLTSSYYVGNIPTLYFIARCGLVSHNRMLLACVRRELRLPPIRRSSLMNALLLTTALRLQCEPAGLDGLVRALLAARQGNHWPAAALYVEPAVGGIQYYAGSAALTTAFVCEALNAYQTKRIIAAADKPALTPVSLPEDRPYRLVRTFAADSLDGTLKADYLSTVEKIQATDYDGQIGNMAMDFAHDCNITLTAEQLDHLHIASINGWVAYTLYDDILDGEAAARLLGAANIAQRRSVEHFRLALPKSPAFQRFVQQTFQTMDAANAWEAANAHLERRQSIPMLRKLPEYGSLDHLAHTSWGHVLPTCAVLVSYGFRLDGPEITVWQRFFRHFLIARQLNDDAHDWQEDMLRGRLTPVVCRLLEAGGLPAGLPASGDRLTVWRQKFWQETVGLVCADIEAHVQEAAAALMACRFIHHKDRYHALVKHLQAAVDITRRRQRDALDFMSSFSTGLEIEV